MLATTSGSLNRATATRDQTHPPRSVPSSHGRPKCMRVWSISIVDEGGRPTQGSVSKFVRLAQGSFSRFVRPSVNARPQIEVIANFKATSSRLIFFFFFFFLHFCPWLTKFLFYLGLLCLSTFFL